MQVRSSTTAATALQANLRRAGIFIASDAHHWVPRGTSPEGSVNRTGWQWSLLRSALSASARCNSRGRPHRDSRVFNALVRKVLSINMLRQYHEKQDREKPRLAHASKPDPEPSSRHPLALSKGHAHAQTTPRAVRQVDARAVQGGDVADNSQSQAAAIARGQPPAHKALEYRLAFV